MTIIVTDQPGDTATIQDAFLAIIGSDAELVRREFEAIIAAEWPVLPPQEPGGGDTVDRPSRLQRCPRTVGQVRLARRPTGPGADGQRRERSPPRRLS